MAKKKSNKQQECHQQNKQNKLKYKQDKWLGRKQTKNQHQYKQQQHMTYYVILTKNLREFYEILKVVKNKHTNLNI